MATAAEIACALWLATNPGAGADPHAVCVAVYEAAERHGEDGVQAVAQAYTESRFDAAAVSPDGCVGPLQIQPRYRAAFCGELGAAADCDDVTAGIGARKRWQRKKGGAWLCHYSSGNACTKAGARYAAAVTERERRLRRMIGAAKD